MVLADAVLAQRRYLVADMPAADSSHVLGAFVADRCVGFLRYFIQLIGAEEGRPPVLRDGVPLREGFVEAFGVAPEARRSGIGPPLPRRRARTMPRSWLLPNAFAKSRHVRRELRPQDQ